MNIPVYAFTGFLESGKTKFIQETLEDPRFNDGTRTLLLVMEEGEEEYDPSRWPGKNVFCETVDDPEKLTTWQLEKMQKNCRAQRVVVELNGMRPAADFYEILPANWQVAQEVSFADANTILTYNANMRSLVVDKLQNCEMVVFNRVKPDADIMPLHKLARALNRRVDIIYEYTDGTTKFDEIEDPLPFDLNADVIEIKDEDYALFYRDITEEAEKYDGKTVRFKAQAARLKKHCDEMFAAGRFVMTCCADDITFLALPCRWEKAAEQETRSWCMVTAKIEVKRHSIYGGVGPILTATAVEPAEAADPDVATF